MKCTSLPLVARVSGRALVAEASHLEQLGLPGLFERIGGDEFLCFTIAKKKSSAHSLRESGVEFGLRAK